MRLISLDISNFRVIRRVTFQFPDSVIGIIGPNGSGKSSLVEAIAWALYGNQAARSGKDEIKATYVSPAANCQVTLGFEIDGEHFRLMRRLAGKSDRPEAELTRGDRPEAVGSTETIKYIEQLLGLDMKGFYTSFLARQQELNALSELAPQKRREHLAGMLGIERLDQAIEKVKNDTRLNAEKASLIGRQLQQREGVETRLRELREHVKVASVRLNQTLGAQTKAKTRLDSAVVTHREHETRKAACSQLKARIDAQNETAGHLAEQVEKLTAEIRELEKSSEELRRLEVMLKDLEPATRRLEELKAARSKTAHRADLQEQLKTAQNESRQIEEKLTACHVDLDKHNQALTDIPEDLEKSLAAAGENLEKARSDWTSESAEQRSADRELAKLSEQIASVAELGPDAVCDRCLRPFGEHLLSIKAHLHQEYLQVQENISRSELNLAALKSEGEKCGKRVAELEQTARRLFEIRTGIESLQKTRADLEARLRSIGGRGQKLSGQLAEIGKVVFDQVEFEKAASKVSRLDQDRQRWQNLTGRIARLDPARNEEKMTREKLSTSRAAIKTLKMELKEIGYDEVAFGKATEYLAAAQQEFEKARDEHVHISKELELLEKEVQFKTEQLTTLEKAAEELETYRTNQYYGEKLRGLFTDFRKFTIARIRPRLAELAGELLAEMTGGRYAMLELDEQYNMSILDNAYYYGVDRFSGGEKDLANLCLRLAISLALSESAGLERSYVILDEVFGSQDNDRRDRIFDGLVGLRHRFPQMLLITHIDEIRDKVECLIEVTRTAAGWSELKMNGDVI